jgi:hypothetical protein
MSCQSGVNVMREVVDRGLKTTPPRVCKPPLSTPMNRNIATRLASVYCAESTLEIARGMPRHDTRPHASGG